MRALPLLAGAAVLAFPASAPAADRASLGMSGAQRVGKERLALTGVKLEVRGSVDPYVEGETVSITVREGDRTVRKLDKAVAPGESGRGTFTTLVRPRRSGRLTIVAKSDRVRAQLAVDVISPRGRGPRVARLVQARLAALGYATSRSGRWDDATRRALLAYRKVNRMARTKAVSATIVRRLAEGRGAFRPKYPGHGRHVEADLSRQVLALIDAGGRVYRVFHTSSGKPSTPTVLGSFSFYMKTPGTNAKGMVDANYFIRGYAIHGYREVPAYAASHGCLRVPIPNASFIYRWVRIGDRIDVYR